jgi:hypothetical protein
MTYRPAKKMVSIVAAAASDGWTVVMDACRAMISQRNYHPEAHYMRGHGPKWRAKHLQT